MMKVPSNSRMTPLIQGRLKYFSSSSRGRKHSLANGSNSKSSDIVDFDLSCGTVDADMSIRASDGFHLAVSKADDVVGDQPILSDWHLKGCLKVRTQRDSLARISRTNMTSSSTRQHFKHGHSCELPPVIEKKMTSFGTVEFREYERRMSDNISMSCGPPIGIGWRYDPKAIILDLDLYECGREGSRRTEKELAIPSLTREDMLLEAGYSRSEIRLAAKRARKDKERRSASFNRQKFDPFLEKVETVKHGVKRMIPGDALLTI